MHRTRLFHTRLIRLKNASPQDRINLEFQPMHMEARRDLLVKFTTAGVQKTMDPKYRYSYSPIYEAPAARLIAMAKRVTMGYAIFGLVVTKMMFDASLVVESLAMVMGTVSLAPFPIVQYLTHPYVSRIYRVYDKTQPQTLENLVKDERLIFEKINWSGKRTYNHLVAVENLQLADKKRFGWVTWKSVEPESVRQYYVADNVGGFKMDRVWGIAEKNSGVNNGRRDFFSHSIK